MVSKHCTYYYRDVHFVFMQNDSSFKNLQSEFFGTAKSQAFKLRQNDPLLS